jgi:hypothetical protein
VHRQRGVPLRPARAADTAGVALAAGVARVGVAQPCLEVSRCPIILARAVIQAPRRLAAMAHGGQDEWHHHVARMADLPSVHTSHAYYIVILCTCV